MSKTLKQLLLLLPDCLVVGNADIEVFSITDDSRQVEPGSLFVCLVGIKSNGHDYILQAKQRGAVAVLVEKDVEVDGITVIKVPSTRAAMQSIVPAFFDYPGHKVRMIGVTGTNGKTTTTYIIRSILMTAGYKVGVIGTINTIIGDRVISARNTTPDVVELQTILAEMVDNGIDYVVMEVSSHALALDRVAGCEFDIAVFTNITRDHLDFHESFDNYIAAKAALFKMVKSESSAKDNKAVVVNIDDAHADKMLTAACCRSIKYGLSESADLKATNVKVNSAGVIFELPNYLHSPLKLNITGVFNVYNTLAAIGVALAENIDVQIIKQAVEEFTCVPGRFELVAAGQPFTIIVDYAHTPDGLENILETARQFAQKRIIVVFGCGGDRDRTKRPIMGKIAAEYADIVIATSDNPRTEEPEAILSEIEAGIKAVIGDKIYEKITDRREAIQRAIMLADDNDIVIIAGKGHETYQILKDRTISFDDRQVACEAVRELN